MTTNTFLASEDDPPMSLTDTHVGSFLQHLQAAGYAERTLRSKRSIAVSFVRWTRCEQISLEVLNESHMIAFVERSPRRPKGQVRFELAALRPFLGYLQAEAVVPVRALQVVSSPAEEIRCRYVDYLSSERGLAENSVCVYSPYIRDFLTELMTRSGRASPRTLDALAVQDFLLDHIRGRSSEYSRLLATALRSFLRFLFLRGETPIDLSFSIPMVRRWAQASVPLFISPEDVERVLSATDRSIPGGLRDHAILLLLARLGLRAGEVVALELADIHWRTGELVVRGKGRMIDRLPLLSDIGEALALYIRTSRGRSGSRRVFLRTWAPRIGLAGHAAVSHIVRKALAKADVHSPKRIAAHLFRHSLATRMIRTGASMAEISELLRHRSQNSTAIYAKVAFEALRGVARPWPTAGGGR
jgi:site-specific recombinase XerD